MSNSNDFEKKENFLKIAIPLWLGSALSIIGDSTIYAVLPLYIGAVGISLTDAGMLMGINRVVRLLSNSIFGYLFDFGNRKKILIVALFVSALSALIFGFCSGFTILFIARILWGIAWSGIIIGGTSILIEETTSENRGKWTGMYYFWISIGNVFGSVVGGFLSGKIGFQPTMAINGFLSLCGAVFVLIALPNLEKTQKEEISFANFKKNYTFKFDLTLVLYAVIFGISRFIFSGFIASLLSVITKEKISPFIVFIGISTLTGLISGSRTAMEMCFTPLAGFVSDKFKNRLYAVIVSLLFGVVGLIVITLAPPYMTLLGLLLCTVPSGSITVLVRTLVGDFSEEKKNHGRSIGFVLTAGDLCSAVGPIFAFRLLPYISMDTIYRSFAIVLLCLIIVIIVFIKITKAKQSVSR